jgi:hypothetical protein
LSSNADFALDSVSKWSASVKSSGVESSLRFSVQSGCSQLDGSGQSQFEERLLSMSVSYFDVSAGFYNFDKRLIYPTTPEICGAAACDDVGVGFTISGSSIYRFGKVIRTCWRSAPDQMFIRGICRDLIANPEFLRGASGRMYRLYEVPLLFEREEAS